MPAAGSPSTHGGPGAVAAPDRGFSLLDLLAASTVLALGLMAYLSSVMGSHGLATEDGVRNGQLQAVHQFVARLRADEDWPTLYTRLRTLQRQARKSDTAGVVTLDSGIRAYRPSTYFTGFAPPPAAPDLAVLVEVPDDPLPTPPPDETGTIPPPTWGLREDVTHERFGLPADLNMDGAIDDQDHAADAVVVPAVITFRWTSVGNASELRVPVWLSEDR